MKTDFNHQHTFKFRADICQFFIYPFDLGLFTFTCNDVKTHHTPIMRLGLMTSTTHTRITFSFGSVADGPTRYMIIACLSKHKTWQHYTTSTLQLVILKQGKLCDLTHKNIVYKTFKKNKRKGQACL